MEKDKKITKYESDYFPYTNWSDYDRETVLNYQFQKQPLLKQRIHKQTEAVLKHECGQTITQREEWDIKNLDKFLDKYHIIPAKGEIDKDGNRKKFFLWLYLFTA
jgi:hypothetical protein